MKKLKYIFLAILLFGAFGIFYAYTIFFGPTVYQETALYIPSESSYEVLLGELKANDLIANESIFSLLAEKMNLKNNVHAGRYVFEEGTNSYELISKLRGGMQTPVKLLINNVNFKEDLAAKIASQVEIDSLSVWNLIHDEEQISAMGYNSDNVMCLFIPNTYEVYWNLGLESLLSKFKASHAQFWNETRTAKANSLGLTPNEVFVLASIVEKEYKHLDERKRIAGVYVNRLGLGMKLQADPSCKFALGDLSIKRVLTVHTEYDHPYNTYYYAGLPPGPICLPETSTIEDVLNAEDHNYLYFCAKEDLSGYHSFSKNYSDHLKAARLYQAALNKLQIYE
ncbi:MAG: UPF0755 protein [Chitinophagales bacterium]|jgi:UPF0755 protein